jgi:hypothetical protein
MTFLKKNRETILVVSKKRKKVRLEVNKKIKDMIMSHTLNAGQDWYVDSPLKM